VNLYPSAKVETATKRSDGAWVMAAIKFNRVSELDYDFSGKELYNHASYANKCAKERLIQLLRYRVRQKSTNSKFRFRRVAKFY